MADVAPPSSFTTGMMDVDEHSFTWTIENFSVIQSFKSMIAAQKVEFAAGGKVGRPSKWKVYLQESTVDGKEWIGIFFKVVEPSPQDPCWENALAEMDFVMEGAVPFNRNTGPLEVVTFTTTGWGFQQFIPAGSTQERLVIKHRFKLSFPSMPNEAGQPAVKEFQVKLADHLLYPSITENDFKLISKDKMGSSASSNMKHVMSPSSFETGMMAVEEKSLTWTIGNFHVIGKEKSLIDEQHIYFSAGTSVGHPSRWRVYLRESTVDGKKWISIYFNIVEPPASDPSWINALAEMEFVMEGVDPIFGSTGPKKIAAFGGGWGCSQLISAESTLPRLVVKQTFKLYVPSTHTEAWQPTLEELQVQFATQAKKDLFALLVKDPYPGKNIKIMSNDKKEFSVKMGILEVRSPVLKAMLKNDMIEAHSGVIQLPDISSKGLEVLIPFLSTGELHPDWSKPEVVVELTNAAGKYQLQDLLKFLDATLGKICKQENALVLFILANQFSLKKAEVELLKFIREKCSGSPETYCKILSGLLVTEGGAGGIPFSRTKSSWTLLRPFRVLFPKSGKKK